MTDERNFKYAQNIVMPIITKNEMNVIFTCRAVDVVGLPFNSSFLCAIVVWHFGQQLIRFLCGTKEFPCKWQCSLYNNSSSKALIGYLSVERMCVIKRSFRWFLFRFVANKCMHFKFIFFRFIFSTTSSALV